MYGQKDNLCPGAHSFQSPCRLDAVQHGHRNVEHQQIGLLRGGFVEQRLTIADRPDHLELRFEQAHRDSQELEVVIGQQHTKAFQWFVPGVDRKARASLNPRPGLSVHGGLCRRQSLYTNLDCPVSGTLLAEVTGPGEMCLRDPG